MPGRRYGDGQARYDRTGRTYACTRQADPRVAAVIDEALLGPRLPARGRADRGRAGRPNRGVGGAAWRSKDHRRTHSARLRGWVRRRLLAPTTRLPRAGRTGRDVLVRNDAGTSTAARA